MTKDEHIEKCRKCDGNSIYDGNKYISLNSERGQALYKLFHVGIPHIDEENKRA